METNMNRRKFCGHLVGGAAALALVSGGAVMLSGCPSQTSVINEVLKLLPTISGIAQTVGNIVGGLDPALALPIATALGIITAAFTVIQTVLTQYEQNLSAAPNSVWQTLDDAVASIEAQISSIEALFPKLSEIVKAGVQVALGAFQSILGFIASLMPAPMARLSTPKAYASLNSRGIAFGVAVQVPSRRQFAKTYNASMDAAGLKGQHGVHIHVPLF